MVRNSLLGPKWLSWGFTTQERTRKKRKRKRKRRKGEKWKALAIGMNISKIVLSLKQGQQLIDWYCFYYFMKNCLVALFARIFWDLRSRCTFIIIFLDVCARVCWAFVSNKNYFHPFQPGSCAWFLQFLLCANHTCALACMCLYMRVRKCLIKMIHVNKYKRNRDHVTCNM